MVYKNVDIERTAVQIKLCREEVLGISRRKLGNLLGISGASVAQWENAVCLPSLDKAIELSKVLGMDVNGFIVRKER